MRSTAEKIQELASRGEWREAAAAWKGAAGLGDESVGEAGLVARLVNGLMRSRRYGEAAAVLADGGRAGLQPSALAQVTQASRERLVRETGVRVRASRIPSEVAQMGREQLRAEWARVLPQVHVATGWPDVPLNVPKPDEGGAAADSEADRSHFYRQWAASSEDLPTWQLKEQIDLETRAVEREVEKYAQVHEELVRLGKGANVSSRGVLLRWYTPLVETISREQATEQARAETRGTDDPRAYLTLLGPQKLAVLTLHTVLGRVLIEGGSVPFTVLASEIGRAVQNEVNYERLLKGEGGGARLRRSKGISPYEVSLKARLTLAQGEWSNATLVKVGGLLIQSLLESCTVVEEEDVVENLGTNKSNPRGVLPLDLNDLDEPDDDFSTFQSVNLDKTHTSTTFSMNNNNTNNTKVDVNSKSLKNDIHEHSLEEDPNEIPDLNDEEATMKWFMAVDIPTGVRQVPAFTHLVVTTSSPEYVESARGRTGFSRPSPHRKQGRIVPHPNVMRLLEIDEVRRSVIHAHYLPMVVPPKPWTGLKEGGYLTAHNSVMRTRGSYVQFDALKTADMSRVFRALDVLGENPWIVHERLFDVMQEAWRMGGDIADMPSRINLPMPPFPSLEEVEEGGDDSSNTELLKDWKRQVKKVARKNRNLHSLRCDTLLKLQVAKEFRGRTLFFPHNLDFRGRTYPIPPHLNHMGQDLCRALLVFAEPMPLGPRGLHWLKRQLANLYGKDKITYEEREAWVDSQMADIFASAEAPLDPRGAWWRKADSPWQALACCMELRDALQSGHPESFVSHLPVHQDGSCNGLQHYAALGGDEFGAQQVNLIPSDRPQDVYSGVARLVAERVRRDAQHGNELARIVDGRIERKIVKQTIMTSVYGVTTVGARAQIENAMADKPWAAELDDKQLFRLSLYVAQHTFDALQEMFVGARQTMTWLGDCAQAIAREGRPVRWTTPLGLAVVQPYRRKSTGSRSVRTLLQTVLLAEHSDDLPVLVQKQRSAFPPNYVHSLDSTHMMMTALACRDRDMPFAAVHDSFWTLAGHSDLMFETLRNQFVDLHSQPLLLNLREQFLRENPGILLPPVPRRGNLDVNVVKQSLYFFQ